MCRPNGYEHRTYNQGDCLEFLCNELEVCVLVRFEYRELINISFVIYTLLCNELFPKT